MNTIDVLIILLTLVVAARSWQLGIFRQIFALAGFWGGLLLGAYLSRQFLDRAGTEAVKFMVSVGLTLGVAFLLMVVGEYIGFRISQVAAKFKVRWLDGILGAVAGAATTLLGFWLMAALLVTSPTSGLRQQIASSRILTALSDSLPPVPSVIAQVARALQATDFPQVFIDPAPTPAPPVEAPIAQDIQAVVDKVKGSVPRIEGISCQELAIGSGFVVAPELVVTNAHVVAGVRKPAVKFGKTSYTATVVLFDPNLDIAVLRIPSLKVPALPVLNETVGRGTKGAVLGYPQGGSFTATPAGVTQRLAATGRNIYNRDATLRSIYELQTTVISGNSGGPLIDLEGQVVGVVFGRSENNDSVGYALTTPEVVERIDEAKEKTAAVSTGPCLVD